MDPGGEGKANPGGGGGAKGGGGGRKRKFLPHGKPVRKGDYPLRPGVQGFFITCDGGRERQATREALSLLDYTICMIGVVERYKELAKFNLRQLTSAESEK